jgi:hypothetical protein
MKTTWLVGMSLLCVGVTAGAQSQTGTSQSGTSPATQSTSPRTQAPAPTSGASPTGQTTTMTLTGCIQRADRREGVDAPRAGGAPGSSSGASTSGVRNDAEQYTLTNVSRREVSGNASSSAAAAAASSYVLQGQRDDLRAHVGHQVEVTAMQVAMPQNNAGDSRPASAATAATSGSSAPGVSGTSGTAASGTASASTTPSTPESAANPDSARGTGTPPPATLMVQSVRMLAASCTPATTP